MGDARLRLVAERLHALRMRMLEHLPLQLGEASRWSLKYQTVKTKSQSWRARSIRVTPRAIACQLRMSAVRYRSERPQVQWSDSERTSRVSQRQLLGDDPTHRRADDVGALHAERAGGGATTSAKSSELYGPPGPVV